MIRENLMAICAVAALGACAASYGMGRLHQSQAHAEQKLKDKVAAFELATQVSDNLVKVENELLETQKQLEEAANAEPVNSSCGIPASRVLRLNLR